MLWLVLCLLSLGCGDAEEESAFERAVAEGVYCCTTNGRLEDGGDPRCPEAAENVEVYQLDFRDLDERGRGRMCGWWL